MVAAMVLFFVMRWLGKPWWSSATSSETVRSGPALLLSVRELARLELLELHLEKVLDLAEKQSRFFGLIETTDAILLVAAGDVTLGVDLSQ
jgi:hypothetical protein